MSQIDVWCSMPELSSSRQGDYVATPVVAQITDYSNLKLTPSPGEVASVFTGVYVFSTFLPTKPTISSATGHPHRPKISRIHTI